MWKSGYTFAALLMLAGLSACDKDTAVVANRAMVTATAGNQPAATTSPATVKEITATAGNASTIRFAKTPDGSPLEIKKELFDTPASREFLATGKDDYVGNAEAIARGQKLFQLYSCTQCHGPEGHGQIGPNLRGPDFRYAKDATNKGMFETIWNGSLAGMGGKGKGLMNPSDANDGLTPDEILKIIAWIRGDGKVSGN
jgi:cytochrome c-L